MQRSYGVLGFVSLCVACSSPDRPERIALPAVDRPDVPERAPDKSSDYQAEGCFLEAPAGYAVDCGYVTVPESASGDRTLQLAVMVLYTASEAPGKPVVYLEGGPGGSAVGRTAYAPFPFEHILKHHDLVLLDQRGTGYSEPSIYCPDDVTADIDDVLESFESCKLGWQDRGVDLAQYNTRQNARDVDLVRQALGYDNWHLYGISYGSRLALTIARDFPEHVSSMVIDGVLPLQADFLASSAPALAGSLEAVNAGCLAQSDCAEAYGDSVAKLFSTVDRLNADPVPLRIGSTSFDLSGSLLFAFFTQLLYAAEVLPFLPAMIDQVHSERYDIFELLVVEGDAGSLFASGMYYSVICQDEAPFTSVETIESARADLDPHYTQGFDASDLLRVCDIWDVPASPVAENEVVVSDIPTLVTSGAYDPVTPPAFGSLAVEGLTNAQEFVLAGQSHGASLSGCGMQLVEAFFADPTSPVPPLCLRTLRDPDYLVDKRWGAAPEIRFRVAPEFDTALLERLRDALERSHPRYRRAMARWVLPPSRPWY